MPSNLKRKRELHDSDSDNEEIAFGKQILPVANLPLDYDGEPEDGTQYLFTVRRDARSLPHFTRVLNPYAVPEPTVPQPSISNRPSHPAMPSNIWCALFESRFRNLRANLNQPTIFVGPTHEPERRIMPDKKERDLWWAFLEGKPEEEWNITKKSERQQKKKQGRRPHGLRGWANDSEQDHTSEVVIHESSLLNDEGEVEEVLRVDPTEHLQTPSGTPTPSDFGDNVDSAAAQDLRKLTPREPSTKCLKLIDEPTALHLLMYFTHWINNHVEKSDRNLWLPRNSHARWIFALLSRIDDQICADDMNLLRNLARACLALLKHLIERKLAPTTSPSFGIPDSMSNESCWILISIVVHVWKQKDLWMDAENMLARFPATAV